MGKNTISKVFLEKINECDEKKFYLFDKLSGKALEEKEKQKLFNKEIKQRIDDKLIKDYLSLGDDAPNKKEKWRELVASLPCGFCLGATMTTNYQQLKTMYLQRKYHKLSEWHEFCKWCESLPHFVELTGVDKLSK